MIGVRVIEEGVADHDYAKQYKQPEYMTQTVNSAPLGRFVSASGYNGGSHTRVFYACNGLVASSLPISGYSFTTGCLYPENHSSNSVVAFGAAAPTFDASTTWGAKLVDKVKEVSFKRSTNITDLEIYYASRASLIDFGIDFENTKQIFAWPAAFEDKKRYCKLPPGYKA